MCTFISNITGNVQIPCKKLVINSSSFPKIISEPSNSPWSAKNILHSCWVRKGGGPKRQFSMNIIMRDPLFWMSKYCPVLLRDWVWILKAVSTATSWRQAFIMVYTFYGSCMKSLIAFSYSVETFLPWSMSLHALMTGSIRESNNW